MRVALICRDKPGHLQVRLDNRSAHLAHIDASGVVEMAGPFLSAEGQMTGSLVILNVDTLQAAVDTVRSTGRFGREITLFSVWFELRWGIVGTGWISTKFATALRTSTRRCGRSFFWTMRTI